MRPCRASDALLGWAGSCGLRSSGPGVGRGCADLVSPRLPRGAGGRLLQSPESERKRVLVAAASAGASFTPMGKPSRPALLEKLLDGGFDLQVLAVGGELAALGQAAAVRVFNESVVLSLFLFQ